MPKTRENHCDTMLVCSLYGLLVLQGPAGLNNCGNSRFCRFVNSIPEREERIGRHHRTFRRWVGLLDTYLARIPSAHLSCTHSYRATLLRQNDGVGLHMFGDTPGEFQIVPFVV